MSNPAPSAHILVVDDDQATLGLYRDLLLDAGYEVTLLTYPPNDPAEVGHLGSELVVLDLIFNGEERGRTFLRSLRQHPATSAIPVLVCTAAAHLIERHAAEFDAWSCGVLLKPFDIDRLLAALDACFEQPHPNQAAG